MESLSKPWATLLRLKAWPNELLTTSLRSNTRLLASVASSSKLLTTYLMRKVTSTAKSRSALLSTEMPFLRVRARLSNSLVGLIQLTQTFLKYEMCYRQCKALLLAMELSLSLPRMSLIRVKSKSSSWWTSRLSLTSKSSPKSIADYSHQLVLLMFWRRTLLSRLTSSRSTETASKKSCRSSMKSTWSLTSTLTSSTSLKTRWKLSLARCPLRTSTVRTTKSFGAERRLP